MQPRTVLICALLGAGCFHDHGSSFTDGTTTGTDGSGTDPDHDSSGEEPDDSDTDSMSTLTTTSSSAPDSATTDTTDTSTENSTSSDGCVPVDVEVDGPFEELETRTLDLDFDEFPGIPGEAAELCASFTTTNPASARTITIGGATGEVLSFGPCGGHGPGPGFTLCASFVKPLGLSEIVIDNSNYPGCQAGPMDDLVLQFGCIP